MLAAFLLAACTGGPEQTGDVKSGPAPGEAVKIEAGDNFFKPDAASLKPGEKATLEITNSGKRPHDWTVDALELSTGVMSPGRVFHATFTVPDGEVEFVCTLHAGMDGVILTS